MARAEGRKVVVEGLDELRRDLRRASQEAPKLIQRANKTVAEGVAHEARSKYIAAYRAGPGASSIRPLASQRRAQVALGRERLPYVVGQNFGSNQGPRKRQFPPVRRPDYFLYATVDERKRQTEAEYFDVLDAMAELMGFV